MNEKKIVVLDWIMVADLHMHTLTVFYHYGNEPEFFKM